MHSSPGPSWELTALPYLLSALREAREEVRKKGREMGRGK